MADANAADAVEADDADVVEVGAAPAAAGGKRFRRSSLQKATDDAADLTTKLSAAEAQLAPLKALVADCAEKDRTKNETSLAKQEKKVKQLQRELELVASCARKWSLSMGRLKTRSARPPRRRALGRKRRRRSRT